jgi:hypothetical protein
MELQVAPQGPSSAILFDMANFQDSPEQPSAALPVDECFRNSAAKSSVNSRRNIGLHLIA